MLVKSLRSQIEEATLPEWSGKLLSYKELKKRLKRIERSASGSEDGHGNKRPKLAVAGEVEPMTEAEVGFVKLLDDELEKLNAFFIEKEEEYIIRLKDLQDRVAKAEDCGDEKMKMMKEIVNFHGEMVFLENYSALNYIGLVKMLKKYEKRIGRRLRVPFIKKMLQQPFFSTDALYNTIKECETMIGGLLPVIEAPSAINVDGGNKPPLTGGATKIDALLSGLNELSEIENVQSLYMERTISALQALKLDS